MSNFNIDARPVAAGYVLAQGANGRFKPVDPGTLTPAGHLTPAANNTYDLGITGTRWRTAYLGTSLDAPKWTYAGNGEIDLTGAATRTLTIRNSTSSQVTNIDLDGLYAFRNGTAYTMQFSGTPTANRVFTFPDVADDTVALLGAAQTFSGAKTFSAAVETTIDDATTNAVTRGHTLSHTTSGTATAGIGAGMLMRAESGAGTLRSAGAVDAIHTDVTDGAEVSALILSAGIAGTLYEVARLAAVASAVNGVSITAEATGNTPVIEARGGDTNIGLNLNPKGTGSVSLRSGSDAQRIDVNNTGIGFYGLTPVAQGAHIPDAAGGATVDAEARAALNTLLAHLRLRGDLAAS